MKPEGGPCGAFLQRRRYGSLILEESYYYVKPTSVFCNACVGTSVLVMYLYQSKKRVCSSHPMGGTSSSIHVFVAEVIHLD